MLCCAGCTAELPPPYMQMKLNFEMRDINKIYFVPSCNAINAIKAFNACFKRGEERSTTGLCSCSCSCSCFLSNCRLLILPFFPALHICRSAVRKQGHTKENNTTVLNNNLQTPFRSNSKLHLSESRTPISIYHIILRMVYPLSSSITFQRPREEKTQLGDP